jgi:hypothetical protein
VAEHVYSLTVGEPMKSVRLAFSLASLGGGGLAAAVLGTGLLSGCLPEAPKAPAQPKMEETVNIEGSLSARQMFDKQVKPLLSSTCGACHSLEVGVGPGFLRSATPAPDYDPYPVITTWSNFIVAEPELSALLTKGQHEGPAMTMSQYDTTLAWLKKEKQERDAVTVTPFSQQLPPFAITMSQSKAAPVYNKIPLDKIDPAFVGAYIQFVALPLNSTTGTGLEISDLRFFNRKPGAAASEQRSIFFKNPLFVLWRAGVPYPDPAQSFYGFERTIKLNQDDVGSPGNGVLIIPGIVVLDQYRTGYSLSIVFDKVELVKPVLGGDPCTANQLTYFTNNIVRYLGAKTGMTAASCAAATCHDATTKVAEIDMSPTLNVGANLVPLCEQLKFYNNLGVITKNTDPNSSSGHPFKWTTANNRCGVLSPAENPCFDNFKTKLDTWKATQ